MAIGPYTLHCLIWLNIRCMTQELSVSNAMLAMTFIGAPVMVRYLSGRTGGPEPQEYLALAM